jgi:L-threonylcarbamoyladenylate synthase
LRPGLVSAGQIAKVLRCDVLEADPGATDRDSSDIGAPAASSPLASPGQLAVHYAPRARAILFDGPRLTSALAEATGRAVVLARTIRSVPAPHTLVSMPQDAPDYASRLYAALREADALDPSLIAIERPPATGPIWDAIADRLKRATA